MTDYAILNSFLYSSENYIGNKKNNLEVELQTFTINLMVLTSTSNNLAPAERLLGIREREMQQRSSAELEQGT